MCLDCMLAVLKRTPTAEVYTYASYPEHLHAVCEWCRREINMRRVKYEEWKG